MKTIVATLSAVLLVGVCLMTGIIGVHYPRVIQNEPLRHPLTVVRIETNRLWLDDGRVIELDGIDAAQVSNKLSQSDFKVDAESSEHGVLEIYARQNSWICGTPWAQPIRIPLICDTVYKNRRESIALGKFVEVSSQQVGATYTESPRP